MAQVIEGEWDELVKRSDLHGRRVRITVLEEELSDTDPWLKALHEWADEHAISGVGPIDDRRDSIYSGTMDDPR